MKYGIFALVCASLLNAASANAMEVSFEEEHNLPIVYVNVAVKAGAVNDPSNASGLTNFMGEMLLRGTRSRTKEQLDLALDQMGAQLAVETRAEAMIVRGAVLSSQLEPFIKLVTEILTQPSFPEAEIRKLQSEVISGILEEMGRDHTLASRKFNEFLFQGHPYGNPILGKVKDIEKVSRDQVVSQYENTIRNSNLLIVGSGDAKESEIKTWGDLLAKQRPDKGKVLSDQKVPTPKNADQRRLMIVDKPDRTQTQILGGQIGLRMTDKEFFPLWLGNYAFGGGSFSARMMVEIRVKRGWSYGATSSFRQGLRPRQWQFHVYPANKDTAPALGLTLDMIQSLKETGISAEEFDFAQRSLVNGAGFMYNTPQKRVENTLLERTLDLPNGFMKSYGVELQKVKRLEVNEAFKTFLKPDKLAIVVVGTAKDLKEPLAKAAGVPVDQVQVVPYTQE